MSNALALASVTAVLKDLLNNGLIDHDVDASVGEVTVSTLPPDRVDALDAEKKSRLNLFMYQVTPNQGWRNVGLPSRNGDGDRISNPPLALDLHYLLTAYGSEEFHAEILLGYGMQLFHETPVLTRSSIRKSLAPPSIVAGGGGLPPAMEALFTSELAEQFEQIKIAPSSLSTEEISRMWSAFGAKYRPTSVYQVSVVLIESKSSTRSALPVRSRKIKVIQFQQPRIDEIKSQRPPSQEILSGEPIVIGDNLVIAGTQLSSEDTRVLVGGVEVPAAQTVITDSQIIAPVPTTLPAGVQGVQIVQNTLLGEPALPHHGTESNIGAFVLHPTIQGPVLVFNPQGSGGSPRSANLNFTVNPAVGPRQRVVLLLNEFIPMGSPLQPVGVPQAYSFVAPTAPLTSPGGGDPGATANLTIPIKGVKAGSYLVRVQVDGAESPLAIDGSGQFVSPLVTIP